ncbi:3832_t:CDS:1, partial [Cetraspora pellucida]
NFQGTVGLCENCLHAKTKVELKQYDQYCQECYKEAHPPEPEQASPVMISSSTQTSDDSKQIIQLLQEQIKQQAQLIAMLQEQTQTYKAQAQMIVHLRNKVDQFE